MTNVSKIDKAQGLITKIFAKNQKTTINSENSAPYSGALFSSGIIY